MLITQVMKGKQRKRRESKTYEEYKTIHAGIGGAVQAIQGKHHPCLDKLRPEYSSPDGQDIKQNEQQFVILPVAIENAASSPWELALSPVCPPSRCRGPGTETETMPLLNVVFE